MVTFSMPTGKTITMSEVDYFSETTIFISCSAWVSEETRIPDVHQDPKLKLEQSQSCSAVPGHGTHTGYGDELKLQRVAGCGEAAGVFLEDRHPQGHRNSL